MNRDTITTTERIYMQTFTTTTINRTVHMCPHMQPDRPGEQMKHIRWLHDDSEAAKAKGTMMPEVHEVNILFDGIEYCLNVRDSDMVDLPFEDGGCYGSYSKSDHDHYVKVLEPFRKIVLDKPA